MQTIGNFSSTVMPTIKLGFVLTTPDDFDSAKERLPLIVFLHGIGERGSDPQKVCLHGIPKLFTRDGAHLGQRVITLSPQCPDGLVWNNIVFAVKELVDTVAADYSADLNRISITGLSMGGYGTWEMICTYPHFFSAAAPVCGGGLAARANILKDLPIRAFHGTEDPVVLPIQSQQMVKSVNAAGGHAELTMVEHTAHNCWDYAYEQTDLIGWLANSVKE